LNEEEIDKALEPNERMDSITGFYLPPGSHFRITRQDIAGRLWTSMTIDNKDIVFVLKISTDELNRICYVKSSYKKISPWKYITDGYAEYDRWFISISHILSDKQDANEIFREVLQEEDKGI
jgi:hypothetical protein